MPIIVQRMSDGLETEIKLAHLSKLVRTIHYDLKHKNGANYIKCPLY